LDLKGINKNWDTMSEEKSKLPLIPRVFCKEDSGMRAIVLTVGLEGIRELVADLRAVENPSVPTQKLLAHAEKYFSGVLSAK
jgi:hypothetical protein